MIRAAMVTTAAGVLLGASPAAPALAAPVAAAKPAAISPTGWLAPNDVARTFFTGQPFTAATPSNVKYRMTFMADGKVERQPLAGSGKKGAGTWKLSRRGFCTAWNGGKDACFTVIKSGENKWSVLKGSTIMATWSK